MRSRGGALEARSAILALSDASGSPAAIAEQLEAADERCRAAVPDEESGASAERWQAMGTLLRILAAFYRWDEAVRVAEPEPDRFLRSAHRQAEILHEKLLPADHGHLEDLARLTAEALEVSEYADAERLQARLVGLPLPGPLIASAPRRGRAPSAPPEDADGVEPPRAVALLGIDGAPVDDVIRVRPNRVHRMDVLVRVIAWPAELPVLTVRFASVWATSTVEAPPLRLRRPQGNGGGEPLAVEGNVDLVLRASGEEPFNLALQASLASEDGSVEQEIAVLGQRSLSVRAFDPALDAITGAESVDERLHAIFAGLRSDVPESEFLAFARFFSAVARAAVALQVDNVFREGVIVPESEFQAEMQRRLRADPALEGRLERTQIAGGITDLVHDGVNCELKVENARAVDLELARRRIGQPVQYGSGAQRRLSLLCILDMSPKQLPPGVLANNIALLEPELHGGEEPSHPSRVGTIIVPGNLPVPSSWSGTAVPVRD
jgi:hypothetical protein